MGTRSAAGSAALSCLALLATLIAVLPVSSAHADPAPTGPAVFGRGIPPTAGEDFPRMPKRCYESDKVTLKVAPCRITRYGAKRPTMVAWGDSHTWMYLPALRREARSNRVNLTLVVLGSCPPALPLPRSRGFGRVICEKHNLATLDYLRKLRKRKDADVSVLIGGFWSGYRDAYRRQKQADRNGTDSGLSDYQQHMSVLAVEGAPRMFARLGRMRFDVDLIGQAATVPLDARDCRAGREPYQCNLPRAEALSREQSNRRWVKRNLRAPLVGRPRLIDATSGYCTPTICRAHVGGVNTYYDDIHLGARLARTLTGYFTPAFDDVS
jgi:hypothetical protein